MADIRKLIQTGINRDTMRTAFPILNMVIDSANESMTKSTSADNKSSYAKNLANSIQSQLDQVVIEGDSSVEAAQARVDADGETYGTLKSRLDADQNNHKITEQGLRGEILNKPIKKGMISFIYDDGNTSIYNSAYFLHKDRNLPASVALDVQNVIGKNGKLTLEMLKNMRTSGWEVMSHTMSHLPLNSSVTDERAKFEIEDSYKQLRGLGLNPKQFVAANSAVDEKHLDTIRNTYDAAFTNYKDSSVETIGNLVIDDPADIHKLCRANMNGISLSTLKSWADYVESNNVWLVLYEHEIGVSGYTSATTLTQFLDYLTTKNIDVVTPTEAISRISTRTVQKENVNRINQDSSKTFTEGNENLLNNPVFSGITIPVGWSWTPNYTGTISTSVYNAYPTNEFAVIFNGDNTGSNESGILQQDINVPKLLEPLPFNMSVYGMKTGNTKKIKIKIVAMSGSTQLGFLSEKEFELHGNYRQFDVSCLIPNDSSITAIRVAVYPINGDPNNSGTIFLSRPKLSIGVNPTKWNGSYSQNTGPKDFVSAVISSGNTFSIPSSSFTKVLYDSYSAVNGIYNSSSGRVTANKNAIYLISSQIGFQNGVNGSRFVASIYKNGVAWHSVESSMTGNGKQGINIVDAIKLSKNDYIEIFVWQDSGASLNLSVEPYSYLTVSELG
jgi:peptidoglycan/xylan/chitin deacetylase (PgdA/CDA1 family)